MFQPAMWYLQIGSYFLDFSDRFHFAILLLAGTKLELNNEDIQVIKFEEAIIKWVA